VEWEEWEEWAEWEDSQVWVEWEEWEDSQEWVENKVRKESKGKSNRHRNSSTCTERTAIMSTDVVLDKLLDQW